MHSGLARPGRRGVPGRSVLLSAAAMIVAIVLLDVETLAKLASAFQLLVFAFLCAAVIVFRQARRTAYKPRFRAPLCPYLHVAGVIGSLALIPAMGLEATLAAGGITAVGLAWFFLHARKTVEHRATLYDVLTGR